MTGAILGATVIAALIAWHAHTQGTSMRTPATALGYLLFFGAGLATWAFEIITFAAWWGLGGAIAAVLIPPLAAAFPFIYLAREGFSALYFGMWALALCGMALVMIWGRDEA